MASASNEASQGICNGSLSSLFSLCFCMWGIFILLQPLIFIASFKTVYSVTNIMFAFHGLYSKNASSTTRISSCIVLAFFLYWIAWIAWKKPKSRMLKSGQLGGWHISLMSNPSCFATSQNWGSSTFKWVGALSCCMKIGLCTSSLGHFALIEGNTLLIMKSLMTSLVIDWIGLTTCSPRRRLWLPLISCSKVTSGKQPILPSNTHSLFLNLGRAHTHKNMILGM